MLRPLVAYALLASLPSCGAGATEPAAPASPTAAATNAAAASSAPAKVEDDARIPAPTGGKELIGTPALPFAEDLEWLDGEPFTLAQLRGKVVLVRFWTDTCPFCEASAPGLEALHERYGGDGLVVLGLFHPKPRGSTRDLDAIRARAKELGLGFPVASDTRWDTLERWWLASGDGDRAATSVSFLIDAAGVVRWIHPGPEFHPDGPEDHEQCRKDYRDAVVAIEALLDEARESPKKVG